MASGAGTVVIKIVGEVAGLKKGLDDADKHLDGFGAKVDGFGKKMASIGKGMTAGVTLPIIGALGMATKAAAEDEAAQASLAKTLQNTVGATDKMVASVEGYITKAMKASTFTDDELRPAFANLVRETHNVEEAQKLLSTAMDVAAAKNISVEEASDLLVKAHNGQTKALKMLGIETKTSAVDQSALADAGDKLKLAQIAYNEAIADHGPKSTEAEKATIKLEAAQRKLEDAQTGGLEVGRSFDELMKDLTKTVGGSASAATETAAGKTKMLTRDMGELTESLGMALLPVLTQLVDMIRPVIDRFMKMDEGTQKVIVVVGLAVAAIGPLISLIASLSAALAFLALNPVVLIIAGIAGLAYGLYLCYQKSETFRDVVNLVFETVVNTIGDAVGFILDYFATWVGAFATVAEAATKIPGIGDKFKGVAETIRGAEHTLRDWADTAHRGIDLVTNDAERLKRVFEGMRPDLGNIMTLAKIRPMGGGGDFGGARAAGGPVSAGRAYLVGERGPELFVPGASGGIVPGGGAPVVVNVVLDRRVLGRAVVDMLHDQQARTGVGIP